MSRDYSIKIILDVAATSEAIKTIVSRGQEVGIEYIDQKSDECLTNTKKRLTLDESVRRVCLGLQSREDIENLSVLAIKIRETYCWLVFGKTEMHTTILLGPHAHIWMKNSAKKKIDFDKYIRLLLDLCQDFCIVELKTLDSDRDGYA